MKFMETLPLHYQPTAEFKRHRPSRTNELTTLDVIKRIHDIRL